MAFGALIRCEIDFMNAFVNEIIFLATSIRVWLLILLVVFLVSRYRLRSQTDENLGKIRNSFSQYIKVLAWVNGIIFVFNINALFFSGPISGRVVDADTGMPISGVSVLAECSHENAPIIFTWYFELFRQKGKGAGRVTITDADGYYHLPWYGYDSWKSACFKNEVDYSVDGYSYYHLPYMNGKLIVGGPTRAFSFLTIKLTRENVKK